MSKYVVWIVSYKEVDQWMSDILLVVCGFLQMDRPQCTVGTLEVSPVCSHSSPRERPTTHVPLTDAVTGSSGARPPPTLRLTRNIPSVQRRMVSQHVCSVRSAKQRPD